MHCNCGTNNRAPRWTFTYPCKPEVRLGAREESASPAWLAAPSMNARDTTKMYIWRLDTVCGLALYRKCHSHNTPGKKGLITLESNSSRETVLPDPHGKGNKCDKNVKFKRTVDIHGPLRIRGETRFIICHSSIIKQQFIIKQFLFINNMVTYVCIL